MGDKETSQEAGKRTQARGGREENTHLGCPQPPPAAQLLPEQPVAADVVGPATGKRLCHASPLRTLRMTKIPAPNFPLLNYREARPCPGSCRHQAPWPITQWVWGAGCGRERGSRSWGLVQLSRAPGVWGFHLNIMLQWPLSTHGTVGLTLTTWVPIQAPRLHLQDTEVATSPRESPRWMAVCV